MRGDGVGVDVDPAEARTADRGRNLSSRSRRANGENEAGFFECGRERCQFAKTCLRGAVTGGPTPALGQEQWSAHEQSRTYVIGPGFSYDAAHEQGWLDV